MRELFFHSWTSLELWEVYQASCCKCVAGSMQVLLHSFQDSPQSLCYIKSDRELMRKIFSKDQIEIMKMKILNQLMLLWAPLCAFGCNHLYLVFFFRNSKPKNTRNILRLLRNVDQNVIKNSTFITSLLSRGQLNIILN